MTQINDWQELFTTEAALIGRLPVVNLKCAEHGLIVNLLDTVKLADVNAAAWEHMLKEHEHA